MFAGTVIPLFLNALLSYNARAVQFAELKNTVPCSRRIYKVVPPRLRSNFRTSPHPEGGPHTHEQSPPKPSRPRQTATYSHPLWICRFWTFYANGSVQRVVFFDLASSTELDVGKASPCGRLCSALALRSDG